jgi:hypothetical protein
MKRAEVIFSAAAVDPAVLAKVGDQVDVSWNTDLKVSVQ